MVEVSNGQYMVDDVEYFVTTIMPYSMTILSGTLLSSQTFNANSDSESLNAAIKNKDLKSLANILCCRNSTQRQEICHFYQVAYQKNLPTVLSQKLTGDFKNLIISLLYSQAEYDAHELNSAMKGNKHVLIEILSTSTNQEIISMQNTYIKLFSKQFLDDINKNTSDQLKDILINLAKANRNENIFVNLNEATLEALKLQNADKIGFEKFFNEKVAVESYTQLQAIFTEYKKLTGNDIETTVQKFFKGDVEECYLALVKIAKNRTAYFAELLYKSMKGLGTNDKELIRIIVSRCEKDMLQIKEQFEKLYKETLVSYIKDDTSGSYRDGLITLITGITAA